MAALIDLEYFHSEIHIANLSDVSVAETVTSFIDKYTIIYLNKVMGLSLAREFTAAVKASPETPLSTEFERLYSGFDYSHKGVLYTWPGFVNDLKISPLANYIYYYYMVDKSRGHTVGVGNVKSKAENGEVIIPTGKLVRAWNEMICMTDELIGLLHTYPNDYVWNKCYVPFKPINQFSI